MSQEFEMHVAALFPSPVAFVKFGTDTDFHKEVVEYANNCQYIPLPPPLDSTHAVSKPDLDFVDCRDCFGQDVLSKLPKLNEVIQAAVTEYANRVKYATGPSVQASWITQSTKGSYFRAHDHAGCTLSGCYYIQTNGQDGTFSFECPLPAASHVRGWGTPTSLVYVPPVEGMLMIFPSWLRHSVTRNDTDSVRRSLSFNLTLMDDMTIKLLGDSMQKGNA